VQPVEINAGRWYLRALRADDRVDDRPALGDMGVVDPSYVRQCANDWEHDVRYTWAVCEPTTGELLAEVTLSPSTGSIGSRARSGRAEAARTAAETVRRYAQAAGIGP
jgi:hypothetical protein